MGKWRVDYWKESELAGPERSGQRFGFDAEKWRFIARTEEFLERLRSSDLPGREDYEGQIERALQELRRSVTKVDAERVVNEICLNVAIVCYALKAHERAKGRQKPASGNQ